MPFSYLTSFLLGLFLFSAAVDTETDENLQMKFVNGRFHASSSAMCAMLKKADLESKGFRKEMITKEVVDGGTGKSSFQKVYFYYKLEECTHEAMEKIEKDLNSSLPGVIEKEMSINVGEEMKFRHVDNAGQCKIGLEVYFPEDVGCDVRRSKRDGGYIRSARRPRGVDIGVRVSVDIRVSFGRRRRRRRRRSWGK